MMKNYVFESLGFFTDSYINSDYTYDTLGEYYFFCDELSLIESGYGNRSKTELLIEIKKYSRGVIDKF